MWLVTHAAGTVGRAVYAAATAKGHATRVMVRDAAQAALFGSADVAVADPSNAEQIKRAFAGVSGVFITAPLGPDFVQWHRVLAEAAEAAGVRRVVQLTGQGADPNSRTRILRWLGDAESQAAQAGVHATVLRPALYMQVLFKHLPEICGCGIIEAPFRSARWPLVDARDVAEVAVERLAHASRPSVRELTGPQAVDYFEIARVVSKVTGKRVHYVDVCSPKARGRLEAQRVSPRLAEALIEYWDVHATSAAPPRITNEIEALLGRPPRKLVEFVKDHKAQFGGGHFAGLWPGQ